MRDMGPDEAAEIGIQKRYMTPISFLHSGSLFTVFVGMNRPHMPSPVRSVCVPCDASEPIEGRRGAEAHCNGETV